MLIVDYLKQFVAYEMSDMEDPVPLILNKYDPHLSITAIVVAKENDISLITLPPLTSQKVQPTDCTIFGPYGTYYNPCLMTGYCQTQANMRKSPVLHSLLENLSARYL